MLNHFLMFKNETAARAAMPDYGSTQGDVWQWEQSCVIPDQRVVLARAVWDYRDPERPVVVSPESTMPGYFVTVMLPEIDPALRDLPGAACLLICESETGRPVYTADALDTIPFATAIIEPAPAGSIYSFGG